MAFLPRVHNRLVPVSNKNLALRDEAAARKIHLRRISMMAPAIDNKWGGMSNGVREFKQHRYEHVTRNLKRQQLQEERLAEINPQNMLLLDKVVSEQTIANFVGLIHAKGPEEQYLRFFANFLDVREAVVVAGAPRRSWLGLFGKVSSTSSRQGC